MAAPKAAKKEENKPPEKEIPVLQKDEQKGVNGDTAVQPTQGDSNGAKVVYTCVMHPEVQMDKPGKCPTCGMDMTEVKPAAKPRRS